MEDPSSKRSTVSIWKEFMVKIFLSLRMKND